MVRVYCKGRFVIAVSMRKTPLAEACQGVLFW